MLFQSLSRGLCPTRPHRSLIIVTASLLSGQSMNSKPQGTQSWTRTLLQSSPLGASYVSLRSNGTKVRCQRRSQTASGRRSIRVQDSTARCRPITRCHRNKCSKSTSQLHQSSQLTGTLPIHKAHFHHLGVSRTRLGPRLGHWCQRCLIVYLRCRST